MLKNILFPVKKSTGIKRVTEMARFLTIFDAEKVILLNVGKNRDADKTKTLNRMVETLEKEGWETELVFRRGHIPTQIVRAGLEMEASFICMPWKRKNPVRRAIMGNLISDVIRLSNQPVLVHKFDIKSAFKKKLNNVVYAAGLVTTDIKILNYLTDRGLKAQNLFLLHVGERAPDPEAEKRRVEKVNNNLAMIEEKCTGHFDRIETIQAVGGSVSSRIVQKAGRINADLIIIGKADKPKPFEKMTGSVAESLPGKSNCSVLIIPGIPKAGAGGQETGT